MTRSAPVGVFDSGIGGLTVAHEVIRQLPHESMIYFGDTARVHQERAFGRKRLFFSNLRAKRRKLIDCVLQKFGFRRCGLRGALKAFGMGSRILVRAETSFGL